MAESKNGDSSTRWHGCAVFLMYPKAATMPGETVPCHFVRKRMLALKFRFKLLTSAPARPVVWSACKAIWRITVFR